MKYVKKPIPVEALRWEGDEEEMEKFLGSKLIHTWQGGIVINTLEGRMICPFGSYVIRGPFGEYYPCRKEVFEETYQLVEE